MIVSNLNMNIENIEMYSNKRRYATLNAPIEAVQHTPHKTNTKTHIHIKHTGTQPAKHN